MPSSMIDPKNDDFPSNKNIFSCDLMTNAKKHLDFLKFVHEYYVALNDPNCSKSSHESLRRYQELWLPLVSSVDIKEKSETSSQLYPPPDIAWLWHCHRLAPKHYTDYCRHIFGGRILEAHPPFEMAHPTATSLTTEQLLSQGQATTNGCYFQVTLDLWTKMYPHERFFLDEKGIGISSPGTSMEPSSLYLLHGFDLLGSIQRQADFLWQVSGERFGDNDFLLEGVLNYYRFLQLKPYATKQRTILVPTYQIDLMWHTHILSSIEMYNQDCIRIMNTTLHHDDSLTDRSDGGVLDVSFTGTKSLWMKHYGTDYVVAGGMYRGEPPLEYYTSHWRSYEDSLPSIITNIALIGKVGASSTGQAATVPTQWAPLYGPASGGSLFGTASDGSPAFIKSPHQNRYNSKSLKYKTNYVFGAYGSLMGYFHIETREANQILELRVNQQLNRIEEKVAFEKGCCGSLQSIHVLKRKRDEMLQCKELLSERLAAAIPTGATSITHIGSTCVNTGENMWIYPTVLFTSAGGACGGMVYSAGVTFGK